MPGTVPLSFNPLHYSARRLLPLLFASQRNGGTKEFIILPKDTVLVVSSCCITNNFKKLRTLYNKDLCFQSAGWLQFGSFSPDLATPGWTPECSSDSNLPMGLHSVAHAEGSASCQRAFQRTDQAARETKLNQRSTLKASAHILFADGPRAKPSIPNVVREVCTLPMPQIWMGNSVPG